MLLYNVKKNSRTIQKRRKNYVNIWEVVSDTFLTQEKVFSFYILQFTFGIIFYTHNVFFHIKELF